MITETSETFNSMEIRYSYSTRGAEKKGIKDDIKPMLSIKLMFTLCFDEISCQAYLLLVSRLLMGNKLWSLLAGERSLYQ